MGVRVLWSRDEKIAALYDSVSSTAFGPLFYDDDKPDMNAIDCAYDFLDWLEPFDARTFSDRAIERAVTDWRAGRPNIETDMDTPVTS